MQLPGNITALSFDAHLYSFAFNPFIFIPDRKWRVQSYTYGPPLWSLTVATRATLSVLFPLFFFFD